MALRRRHLRERCLQIIYAYKLTKDPIEQVKNLQLSDITKKDEKKFCNKLVDKTIENEGYYEKLITEIVEHWDMERIALIDSIIIKMCLTEFFYFEEIPPKVSINEAIDIAKDFSTRNSGKFVNGVLDAIYEKMKNENKIIKKGKGLIS